MADAPQVGIGVLETSVDVGGTHTHEVVEGGFLIGQGKRWATQNIRCLIIADQGLRPRGRIGFTPPDNACGEREKIIGIVAVHLHGNAKLLEIVDAFDSDGLFFGLG